MKMNWFSILVVTGLSLASSCNMNHQASPAGSDSNPSLAANGGSGFRLEMVSGDGAVENIPSSDSGVTVIDSNDLLTQGNTISLQKRLALPDLTQGEKPLYFVWDQAFGGSTIVSATYDLEQERDGQPARDLSNGQAVPRDSAQGRWFISLSQLFSGHESEMSPLDEQILTLNFLLADGRESSLVLRFMLEGQIPDHLLQSDTLNGLPASLDSAGLYTYAVSAMTNSALRPLVVWARVRSLDVIDTTWISRQRLDFNPDNSQARVIGMDAFFSQAALDPAGLQISLLDVSGVNKTQLLAASTDWASVTVPAGASLKMSWLAAPSVRVHQCQLPGPEPVVVQGCAHSSPADQNNTWGCFVENGGLGEAGFVPGFLTAVGTANWSMTGQEFVTDVSRDLRVTEEGDQPTDAQASRRTLMDAKVTAHGENTTGTPVPGAAVFAACANGIFH
jgi:hypothetical protein